MTIREIKVKANENVHKYWGKQVGISVLCGLLNTIPILIWSSECSILKMCYEVSQDHKIEIKDCLFGVKNRFGESLLVAALWAIYTTLKVLPMALLIAVAWLLSIRFAWPAWIAPVLTILLIIAAIVYVASTYYGYMMTTYILMREPEIDGHVALAKSKEMMVGNKLKLFMLQISFIWWGLTCLLGLPAVYVVPYYFNAIVLFFNDVYDNYQNGRVFTKDKKYCRYCGQAISASSTFCPNCGNNLEHK